MEPESPQSLTDMLASLTTFHNRRVHVEHDLRSAGEQLLTELTLAREVAEQHADLEVGEPIDRPLIEAILRRVELLDEEHAQKRHVWRLLMMELFETSEQLIEAAGVAGRAPADTLLQSTRRAYEAQERAHDSAQNILAHMRKPSGALQQLHSLLTA